MSDTPWLTIIGLGEDGPDGLTRATRDALEQAEVILGPPRHLSLLASKAPLEHAERIAWPVPFSDGLEILDRLRGRPTAVLASGDPFWFGAGSVIAQRYGAHEWRALPGPSCFSLVAAQMGWALDRSICLGLHAAPLSRLRPHLHNGARIIATLRDGAAVADLGAYLEAMGFGASALALCEAMGGPRARVTTQTASALAATDPARFSHPLCVAIRVAGEGAPVPLASGRADEFFASDGQMTKRPLRALALSALAPTMGDHLWDIGGGSGSIAIEWLMAHPSLCATSIEPRADRAARIAQNAQALGQDRLRVVHGAAPDALEGLAKPTTIFVGGGLSETLLARLESIAAGARLVAHGVTLETEALLIAAQARLGGTLLRIELAQAAPLGPRLGWKSAYPVVQWQVTL